MRKYLGHRFAAGDTLVEVVTEGGQRKMLDPRYDLKQLHVGYDWGSTSDGAAQLAIALLADAMGGAVALELYQKFVWQKFTWLTARQWQMDSDQIKRWARATKDWRFQLQRGQA